MIKEKTSIAEVVFVAIHELNQQLPKEQQIEKSLGTVLVGRGARLDSLGLVSLIVGIEEGIAERFDASIILTDEKAMSQELSPFRTVDALVDYIAEQLEEKAHDSS